MRNMYLIAAALLLQGGGFGRSYSIATYAGGSPLSAPSSSWSMFIATDARGDLYVASDHTIFKRTGAEWLRIAGTSRAGYSGDGGPATAAQLNLPWGLAFDGAGNIFVADLYNHRVRKIDPHGIITTVAGNGDPVSSGDGGPALEAGMSPVSVAVDAGGNLYVGDSFFGILLQDGCCGGNNRVRKISPDGMVITIAGGGEDRSGRAGSATAARLSGPVEIAVDSAGNVIVADSLTATIRKVTPDGIISRLAGNRPGLTFGQSCSAGTSSGRATEIDLCLPFDVTTDSLGNVFVAEFGYRCCYDIDDPILGDFAVRMIAPDGTITTVPGSKTLGLSDHCNCADVGRGSAALDRAGNLYASDSFRVRKLRSDGTATMILDDSKAHFAGDGGPATSAQLYSPAALATDEEGNLFIADRANLRVRKVSPGGTITTVAGSGMYGYSEDGGRATEAALQNVGGIAVDGVGNLYLADQGSNRVRRVSPEGIIATVAGGGDDGAGEGIQATRARLTGVSAIAVDKAGTLYIAEMTRVRKVTADGIITTVAGGGTVRQSDGGLAKAASLLPVGLAVDLSGNLFIVDASHLSIRNVGPGGIITTVVGGGDAVPAEGAPPTSVRLFGPVITVGKRGDLFIGDDGRVFRVSEGGRFSVVAGTGSCCYTGDGGSAASARLWTISGLAAGTSDEIYVSDSTSNSVRVLRPIMRRSRFRQD